MITRCAPDGSNPVPAVTTPRTRTTPSARMAEAIGLTAGPPGADGDGVGDEEAGPEGSGLPPGVAEGRGVVDGEGVGPGSSTTSSRSRSQIRYPSRRPVADACCPTTPRNRYGLPRLKSDDGTRLEASACTRIRAPPGRSRS